MYDETDNCVYTRTASTPTMFVAWKDTQDISNKLVFFQSCQVLNLFINDLPLSVTSSQALPFADDTKSLVNIKSQLDSQNLQTDLDAVGACMGKTVEYAI